MLKIYVSGALTNVRTPKKIKRFYEDIGKICTEVGFGVYLPHQESDPVRNPDLTPEEVFYIDKKEVLSCDLLIAYVGYPAIGVGMELAYAEIEGIPIILLSEKDRSISRFPRGIPSLIGEIRFTDYSDGLQTLREYLLRFMTNRK